MKFAVISVFTLCAVSSVIPQLHSGTILSVLQSAKGLRTTHDGSFIYGMANVADVDQTVRMHGLIYIYTGRKTHKPHFSSHSHFAQWISDGDSEHIFSGNEERTVFAFNDTVFNNLVNTTKIMYQSLSSMEKSNYVLSYTLANRITVDQLPNPGHMNSLLGRKLYFIKRSRQYWTSESATGNSATYVNGVMIAHEQIQTSNGIIHVLDSVPSPISTKRVYEWLKYPEYNIQTSYFQEMLKEVEGNYYSDTITPLSNERVTLFLPSQQALSSIPSLKRRSLLGQQLADFIKMHYIPNQVVYTSYVENSENFPSGLGTSNIVFRRFEDKVYVISGGVTALVELGNITVSNGVIHIIDKMLGFVYYTAREQIFRDAPTFNKMLGLVPSEVSSLVSNSSGMNMFVPLDSAFKPWIEYTSNQTLMDMVVQLCMVQDGSVEVSQITSNYDDRQRRTSRFNNWTLVIYNDRNTTWVNGGNVRTRITRPDIKVTNGRLQYIDEVLGMPSMDIPGIIYYDDYLYRTYLELNRVGMALYLQDAALGANQAYITQLPFRDKSKLQNVNSGNNNSMYTTQYPGQSTQSNPNNQYPNNQYPNNQYPNSQESQFDYSEYPPTNNNYGRCGEMMYPCQFTFFVPNGTAIDNYYRTQFGYQISTDMRRYRFMFRRLVIPNVAVYLDRLVPGNESTKYRTDSGETLTIMKEGDNIVRLYWKSQTARVIMWDIGATNGVVHIIDQMLSDNEDLRIDISRTTEIPGSQTMQTTTTTRKTDISRITEIPGSQTMQTTTTTRKADISRTTEIPGSQTMQTTTTTRKADISRTTEIPGSQTMQTTTTTRKADISRTTEIPGSQTMQTTTTTRKADISRTTEIPGSQTMQTTTTTRKADISRTTEIPGSQTMQTTTTTRKADISRANEVSSPGLLKLACISFLTLLFC